MIRMFNKARRSTRMLVILAWLTLLLCGIAGAVIRAMFDAGTVAPVM
ncbi:hypothetical protein [Sphingomonas xinjiangensis]|uniref:Uncharacterized protein n=1 Tax=Sphingomonas xinjiangensis TaxID=643568 RepID=A0A840YG43_9SPHN|nr:hypothetical protein [Sphingomonas xinjiangensis]MBB5711265.1 hypothetical protein [Sphingomonas xinjiangensis]